MIKNAFIIGMTIFVLLWGGNYLFVTSQISRYEEQQVKMIHLSRELSNIQQQKFKINEYYARHGRFPNSNQELGIAPAETFRNTHVKRRTIGPKGLIDVEFDDSIGEEARLSFIPSPNLSRNGSKILWRCFISGIDVSATTQQALAGRCATLPSDITITKLLEESTLKATIDNLINAVYGRRESLVIDLISQGVDVNSVNVDGDTPLSTAIESGNHKMIQLLLKEGSNVNHKLKQEKMNLLMYAIDKQGSRSSTTIKTLLKAGIQIDARDKDGKTALIYAAINDDSNTLRTLIKAGANLKAHDRKSLRALNYAKKYGTNSSSYQTLLRAEKNQYQKKPIEIIIKMPEDDF